MVPRWNSGADELHKIVLLLGYFYPKMSKKHPCKVFMGPAWKGWVLEHFWKSHFCPIFDIFIKMSLKLIPLYSNDMCYLYNVTLVLKSVKITIITTCYDFIVKFQKIDLTDLFGSYRKKDEPCISFGSLEMLMKHPSIKNNSVWVARWRGLPLNWYP